MLSERYNEVTVAFCNCANRHKKICIFNINFYIQQAVSPVGAKRVAYINITNELT